MALAFDHLVFAARTLEEGVDWCESTLGFKPEAGGQHVFMGTHNRVFSIGSPKFPRAYFEVIAIDPSLPSPSRTRWFDLDDPSMQRELANGPRLVHWVARCDDITASVAALAALKIDIGEVEEAQRATPRGMLRWKIALRPDGRRLLGGALPSLIEWGEIHPSESLSDSGVSLESMRVARWPESLVPMLPSGIENIAPMNVRAAWMPPITVGLSTPRGVVTLEAPPFPQH